VIPILLYHFVGRPTLEQDGQSTSRYNVTVEDFDVQLALLHRLNYQTLTIHEVVDFLTLPDGERPSLPARPIAITVDDGWSEQYTQLFPLLQKYGMRATFYVPSSYPVGGRFVTWEQLQSLADAGMEIGAHTHRHVDLTEVAPDVAGNEIYRSKWIIEERLGIPVESMAYPFGRHSGEVVGLVRSAGYRAAVSLGPSPVQRQSMLFTLQRFEVKGTAPLTDLLAYLPWRGQGTDVCPESPSARPLPVEKWVQ
ncbi:MAG: polysaccharide deacetylase family protein, partial [Anaerolineae bacterium]|nr:polysaccharide deacetylase family protein [Anaerolineae bacterium]